MQALVRPPDTGEEATAAARLAPGDSVGRFELLRELGRGGHGVVFEARDRELGRLVALKSLRPGRHDADPAREEALHREAEAVASLHHPSIVTLYDYGRSDAGPYLVLELLRGETLARRLGRGPLPLPEAVRVALDVAGALVHAHGRGVLHRDLKPSNVSLDPSGVAKVLDFGIANVFGRSGGAGAGTPGYMAPEQRAGRREDARTDVYALGLLLTQMITGVAPQPPAGPAGPAGVPPLEGSGLPARLTDLVASALASDPAQRPDAASFLQRLEGVERRLRARQLAGQIGRRFGWIAALAALAVLAALGLWFGSNLVISFPVHTAAETLAGHGLSGWADLGLPPPEEVTFQSEGILLRGWLFHNPRPAGCGVVLLHGKASTRHGMLRPASALLARGCDLLLYDARNHGASGRGPVTFGVHEKLDLLAGVNLLVEHTGLARGRIGLFGASLGASVALQAAVVAPDLAFVIADTPFADFREMAKREAAWAYSPLLVPFAAPLVSVAGWRGKFDPELVSPINEVGLIRIPVLLIHARKDERVPWQDSQLLFDRLTTPRREVRILDWATGHCRAERDDLRRYTGEIDSFLDANVPGFGRAAASPIEP